MKLASVVSVWDKADVYRVSLDLSVTSVVSVRDKVDIGRVCVG